MDTNHEMTSLSQALRLGDERQDWGIVNSDGLRVEEFIAYCAATPLSPAQQFAMGELVLASLNDALLAGRSVAECLDLGKRFVTLDLVGTTHHLRYWSTLSGPEFPITEVFQRSMVWHGDEEPAAATTSR